MIEYECPECFEPMQSPDELAGCVEVCPACGKHVPVPQNSETVAPSESLADQTTSPPSSPQQKPMVTSRTWKGVIAVVVIVVNLVGWAAIRASKGTFWLFDSKPDYTQTRYCTYTDPNHTFSVDFPSSIAVKQHVKNIPAEGGKLLSVRIYTAISPKQDYEYYGFSLSTYQWSNWWLRIG